MNQCTELSNVNKHAEIPSVYKQELRYRSWIKAIILRKPKQRFNKKTDHYLDKACFQTADKTNCYLDLNCEVSDSKVPNQLLNQSTAMQVALWGSMLMSAWQNAYNKNANMLSISRYDGYNAQHHNLLTCVIASLHMLTFAN